MDIFIEISFYFRYTLMNATFEVSALQLLFDFTSYAALRTARYKYGDSSPDKSLLIAQQIRGTGSVVAVKSLLIRCERKCGYQSVLVKTIDHSMKRRVENSKQVSASDCLPDSIGTGTQANTYCRMDVENPKDWTGMSTSNAVSNTCKL